MCAPGWTEAGQEEIVGMWERVGIGEGEGLAVEWLVAVFRRKSLRRLTTNWDEEEFDLPVSPPTSSVMV